MPGKVDLALAYSELAKHVQSREYERVIKSSNKILNEYPEELEALKCKVVALLQLSKFQDIVPSIEKTKFSKELAFEKAYALYRLNKASAALDTLAAAGNQSDVKILELRVQILYRLERFQECQQLYKKLIRESADDYSDERAANLGAVQAQLVIDGSNKDVGSAANCETYEQKYNHGCALLAKGMLTEAERCFKETEVLCRSTLEEDELTEEEMESEMAVIRVQLAYCLQLAKREKEALAIYNNVLKTRPDDQTLVAVACNNVVAINKDQNVFDSKKKMRSVPGIGAHGEAETVAQKLTRRQRASMAFNHCVLAYFVNQMEQCRKLSRDFATHFPEFNGLASRLLAASYWKEKKTGEAVKALCSADVPESDKLENILAAAQMLLAESKKEAAVDVLEKLPQDSFNRLGVVSVLVPLYASVGNNEAAVDLLGTVISRLRESKKKIFAVMLRQEAALNSRLGRGAPAAKALEALLKMEPDDRRVVAQLMQAYTRMGPAGADRAKELSKQLPDPRELVGEVDVDALERANWAVAGAKLLKKQQLAPPSAGSPVSPKSPKDGAEDGALQKKKRKKKKKKHMPKNYDPNVDPDPERWIPRRDRTDFRKKKNRRDRGGVAGIGKGTQGVSSDQADKYDMSKHRPKGVEASGGNAEASTTPGSGGPRTQHRNPQKKKGKKGRR